ETRFYQRPGFYIYSRLIFVLTLYAYALYGEWRAGELTPIAILGDLVLFAIQLFIWLAFFAQFVLPVQTFDERLKIFGRLLAYLSGLRGPAIFVKNGQAVSRVGESERSGLGVLWLDSASGAVTHISVSFKNTFGPGVHFTGWGEKVGETVDLHTQVQKIGPVETDLPFEPKGDSAEDVYAEVQRRRTMVSALSRDGIEVVPNISVEFKIDADPIRGDQPGSHFGYSEEAVRQAVINQAVNPNALPNTLEFKVAWNELPAALAADLWREYLSKFTLGQLFNANLILPAAVPLPKLQSPNPDAGAILLPVAPYEQNIFARALTGMLHVLSVWFGRFADRLEAANNKPVLPARPLGLPRPPEPGRKTALQVINFMIKERMTNPFVPQMDANGQRLPGWQESREFWALKNRGIRVLNVSVSNLRFQSSVEEQLTNSWTSNWLLNARAERERIETARSFAALSGQEKALTDYALELTSDILEQKRASASLKDAVRALLVRSRLILVRSDRMHRRASNELQGLESVMQWLESDPT
ncbi:MAG TPA: hypothetical protein VIV15_07830, partial [Anaerolineales bacterium]